MGQGNCISAPRIRYSRIRSIVSAYPLGNRCDILYVIKLPFLNKSWVSVIGVIIEMATNLIHDDGNNWTNIT